MVGSRELGWWVVESLDGGSRELGWWEGDNLGGG